jgi:hypothetical protein
MNNKISYFFFFFPTKFWIFSLKKKKNGSTSEPPRPASFSGSSGFSLVRPLPGFQA